MTLSAPDEALARANCAIFSPLPAFGRTEEDSSEGEGRETPEGDEVGDQTR